ncbi:DDE superfamily endonuclease [Saccharothrix carnea]|uniref:DDE superfamily endonuclease n=2 Tax=Saccharothrix carnea TaxID=1280637 RepID=A0A2P8H9J9_SACCR|nr:DDE superfamily endonuclease [Saccharothrix carnea]
MHRILDLYDHPPEQGRVICVDEFGPLNLQPRKGRAWRPTGAPRRLRATYNRHHGVMHMLAALDLTSGKIHFRIRRRKRHGELPELLRSLRTRWPDQRLHLVMDNFSPHRHPDVHAWAAAYIRRRNARARPRTGFATDSPIRTWTDYLIEVA